MNVPKTPTSHRTWNTGRGNRTGSGDRRSSTPRRTGPRQ